MDLYNLYDFIKRTAKKELNIAETSTVISGYIESSEPGSYSVRLPDGQVIRNAFPINNSYVFKVNDQVYMIRASIASGNNFISQYYIYGLVQDVKESFFNSSDWDRFVALEGSKYSFSSEQGYEYKNLLEGTPLELEISDINIIRDLKNKKSFCIQGNFTLLEWDAENGKVTGIRDYGLQITLKGSNGTLYKTNGQTAEYILSTGFFTGQPKNTQNSIQKKIFNVADVDNLDSLANIIITLYLVTTKEGAQIGQEAKFFASNILFQVGKLIEVSAEFSAKILEVENQRDYFKKNYNEEDNALISVQAAAYYNSQLLNSAAIDYYWFIKDETVTHTGHEGYSSFGGIGWRILNDCYEATAIDALSGTSSTIKIWKSQDSLLSIGKESDKYKYFNKYSNVLKCVVKYQTATAVSEEYIIYNFNYSDFTQELTVSSTPAIIVNEQDTIICELKVSNKNPDKDNTFITSYQWKSREKGSEDFNNISITSPLLNIVSMSDKNAVLTENIYNMKYATEEFCCETIITLEDDTSIEIKLISDIIEVQSFVNTEAVIESFNYYQYYLSNNMNTYFIKRNYNEEFFYLPTLDTKIITGMKDYYIKNEDGTFEIVETPSEINLYQYWEKYPLYSNWSIMDLISDPDDEFTKKQNPITLGTDWIIAAWSSAIEDDIHDESGSYNENKAYDYLETNLNIFDDIITKINASDENNLNLHPFLFYSVQKMWFSQRDGFYTFLKMDPWVQPKILRRVFQDGGEITSNILGKDIDQLNVFNELSNYGQEEGIFYKDKVKDNVEWKVIKNKTIRELENFESEPLYLIAPGALESDGDYVEKGNLLDYSNNDNNFTSGSNFICTILQMTLLTKEGVEPDLINSSFELTLKDGTPEVSNFTFGTNEDVNNNETNFTLDKSLGILTLETTLRFYFNEDLDNIEEFLYTSTDRNLLRDYVLINATFMGTQFVGQSLYINASYIQTGVLKVAKENKDIFYANVDEGEVKLAGFTATQNNFYADYINPTGVASSNVGVGLSADNNNANNIAIWAGAKYERKDFAPFRVNHFGEMTATDANITGNITAKNLTITEDATITGLKAENLSSISADLGDITAGSISSKQKAGEVIFEFTKQTLTQLRENPFVDGYYSQLNASDQEKTNAENDRYNQEDIHSSYEINGNTVTFSTALHLNITIPERYNITDIEDLNVTIDIEGNGGVFHYLSFGWMPQNITLSNGKVIINKDITATYIAEIINDSLRLSTGQEIGLTEDLLITLELSLKNSTSLPSTQMIAFPEEGGAFISFSNFEVDQEGKIYNKDGAFSGTFSGEIETDYGKIGDWCISEVNKLNVHIINENGRIESSTRDITGKGLKQSHSHFYDEEVILLPEGIIFTGNLSATTGAPVLLPWKILIQKMLS